MKAPHRALLPVVLLLLVVPLAGCIGGDAGGGPGAPAAGADGDGGDGADGQGNQSLDVDLERLDRPTLAVHDWWTYDVSGPWTTEGSHTVFSHVVDSTGYQMATDSADQMSWWLFWDWWGLGPMLGQVDRELNPVDGPVLLDFPLTHNKAWTAATEGDGSWDLVAHLVENQPTGVGDLPAYHIVGTNETGWQIIVVYSPVVKGYALYELWQPDASEPNVRIRLTDHGTEYAGPIVLGSTQLHADMGWEGLRGPDSNLDFEVAEGTTDLWFAFFGGSAALTYGVLLDPAANPVWTSYVTGPGGVEAIESIADPAPGTWTFQLDTVGLDGSMAGGYLRVASVTIETLGG